MQKFLSMVVLAIALHTQLALADLTPPPLPSPKPPLSFDLTLQTNAAGVKSLSMPHISGAFWGFSMEMFAINDIGLCPVLGISYQAVD